MKKIKNYYNSLNEEDKKNFISNVIDIILGLIVSKGTENLFKPVISRERGLMKATMMFTSYVLAVSLVKITKNYARIIGDGIVDKKETLIIIMELLNA